MRMKSIRIPKKRYLAIILIVSFIIIVPILCAYEVRTDCKHYYPFEGVCVYFTGTYYSSSLSLKSLQVKESACINGEAAITVRNTGVETIDVEGEYLRITDSSSDTKVDVSWVDDQGGKISSIEPGKYATFKTTCDGHCEYYVSICGRTQRTSVDCS